jgi:mRNA interferase RelE/StbE
VANYSLQIMRSAAKELESVPLKDRRRIVTRIEGLRTEPRPPGCEKLSGDDKYRIRQGEYHILYEIQDQGLIVTVVRVGDRRDVHR